MVYELSAFLLQWGLLGSKGGTSMFICTSPTTFLIVFVYVDDIIITINRSIKTSQLISSLHCQFALKEDLEFLYYFLGIEVQSTSSSLHLSQTKYINDLLHHCSIHDNKPISSPMTLAITLSRHDGTPLADSTEYRSIMDALQYCTLTPPNLSFVVNKVCQYMHYQQTYVHCQAMKCILRYLQGTNHLGLSIQAFLGYNLVCFVDVDLCPDDQRSTSGYYIFLRANLIFWFSLKQKVVSHSSAKSKYRALANKAAELAWIKSILTKLHIQLSLLQCF